MGAKYGHGLNRLNEAVSALLARLYENVPTALPILTSQERNAIAHQHNVERDDEIRRLRAEGVPFKDLARQFGISTSRAYQVVNRRRK